MSIDIYFLEAVVAVVGGSVGTAGFIRRQHRKSVEGVVREVIKTELPDVIKSAVDGAVRDAIHPVDNRLAQVEGQMDMMKNIAFDIAKVLHHPEESRKPVDRLLDKFLDGDITDSEAAELRGYLEIIRDWEPGVPAPFEIYQGEQVAAAILLHTMNHAIAVSRGK